MALMAVTSSICIWKALQFIINFIIMLELVGSRWKQKKKR